MVAYRESCSIFACKHLDVGCRDMGQVQPADNTSSGMLDAETASLAGRHKAAECDVSRLADVTDAGHSGAPQEGNLGIWKP